MIFHIFTAEPQPAHNFVDRCSGEDSHFVFNPRGRARCYRCLRLRWRSNLVVHVHYDGWRYFCADAQCRSPKKRTKVRNLSRGKHSLPTPAGAGGETSTNATP